MTDFVGKTIRKGDTVVYPNRRGSDLWLCKGKVVGFGTRKDWRWVGYLSRNRPVNVPTLKVEIDVERGYRFDGTYREFKKVVTIERIDRVVKV